MEHVRPEQFRKRPDLVSLGVVGLHIAFVILPLFIAVSVRPGALLMLCWIWFGITAHGLTNLMHESAHYHVFVKRSGSDLLGLWLLAPLFFADFDNYRRFE